MPTLRARIEHVRDVLQEAVEHRFVARGIAYLQGTAQLEADHTVHVTSPEGPAHRGRGARDPGGDGVTSDALPEHSLRRSGRLRLRRDLLAWHRPERHRHRRWRPDQRRVRHRVHRSWASGPHSSAIPIACCRTLTANWLGWWPTSSSGAESGWFWAPARRAWARRRPAQGHALDRYRPGGGRRSVRRWAHAQHRRPRPRTGRRTHRRPRPDPGRPLLPDDRSRDLRGRRCGQTRARLQRHAARTRSGGPRMRTPLRRGDRSDREQRGLRPTRSRRRRGDRRTDPATGIPYAVGRCDLATTPRGAIAGHGGLLKLIFHADTATARCPLLRRHRLRSSRPGPRGPPAWWQGRTIPHTRAQHPHLQLRLPRRDCRRPDPAHQTDDHRRYRGHRWRGTMTGDTRRRIWSSARTRSRPQRVSLRRPVNH